MVSVSASHVSVGKYYRNDPLTLWSVITDTSLWPLWGPTVSAVDCPDRFVRLGSRGRVKTAAGFWLPFRVTGFENTRFWSWKVGPVEATGHRVIAHPEYGCYLWFDTPILAAPYSLVCKSALVRIERLLDDGRTS